MTAKIFCDNLERACGFRILPQIRCCTLLFASSAFVLIGAASSVNSFARAPIVEKKPAPVTISMTCADESGQNVTFRLSHHEMLAYIDAGPSLTVERIIHAGDHLVAFASGDGLTIAARIGSRSSLTRTTDDGARSEAPCDRVALPRLQLRASN